MIILPIFQNYRHRQDRCLITRLRPIHWPTGTFRIITILSFIFSKWHPIPCAVSKALHRAGHVCHSHCHLLVRLVCRVQQLFLDDRLGKVHFVGADIRQSWAPSGCMKKNVRMSTGVQGLGTHHPLTPLQLIKKGNKLLPSQWLECIFDCILFRLYIDALHFMMASYSWYPYEYGPLVHTSYHITRIFPCVLHV